MHTCDKVAKVFFVVPATMKHPSLALSQYTVGGTCVCHAISRSMHNITGVVCSNVVPLQLCATLLPTARRVLVQVNMFDFAV